MATSPLVASRLKTTVPAAETPGVNSLLTLCVGVVVISGLYLAREVLIPITLSVLLSFVLAPLVGLLRRVRVPRVPAVLLAVLLSLGVVVGLGAVLGTQVAQLADKLPTYAATIEKKIAVVRGFTAGEMSGLMQRLGHFETPAPATPAAKPQAPAAGQPPAPIPVEVHQPDPTPLQLVEQVAGPVLSPLATVGIVFVVAIFVLMQQEDLRDRLIRLFGSSDLHRTTAALDDAASRLSRYFLAQLSVNTAFGAIISAGLFFIGVPNPLLWGIVAGLMRFVPYIGSVSSAAFPMFLAAAVDPGWSMMLETLALFLVIEPVVSQLIEPLVYGHRTGLSPVSVVVSAIFWGWLWGVVGLILSMPLTLCLVVMGRHVRRLEFIAVLLGDEPALTPAESLYQRMLAGDTDEAVQAAEQLLKDKPLSAYYDEVVLPALQLAAHDSLRDVLSDEQLQRILDVVSGLVVDLADEEDGTAPGDLAPDWANDAAVLCVAGRGPLDEAVCSMLAHVLAKRGLRARVVASEAVSRSQINAVDMDGVRMLCVSYIEGGNSLSPLRYLSRRLHQRAPDAKLMIGLWNSDPALLIDDRLRTAVGADLYVGGLRDAVDMCIAEARQTQDQHKMVA